MLKYNTRFSRSAVPPVVGLFLRAPPMSPPSYTLKAAGAAAKPRLLAKFRETISAFEPRPGEPAAGTLTRQQPAASRAAHRHGRMPDPVYSASAAGKTFEGSKEAAGAGASTYVLMRVEASDGRGGPRNVQVVPIEEWVTFRPAITYDTLDIDEAEKSLQQMDYRGSKSDARIASLRKVAHDDDAAGDEPAAADFEEDLFDDGADAAAMTGGGGGWEEEDGREGLDVEDEGDMFDDDDDEFFEEDELAAGAREEAAKFVGHEAARVRFGPADDDQEDEVETERPEETSEWRTYQKKILKADRRERRREEDPDYDEEDDDEEEEEDAQGGREMLRRILGEGRQPKKGEEAGGLAEEEVASADSDAEAPHGAKRKAAAGETSGGGAKDSEPKRARTAAASPLPLPAAAAGPSMPVSRHRVSERDVVMLLHEKGAMSLKDLTSHFKELNRLPEEKKHLKEIINRVAKLDKRGEVAQVLLKGETIFNYNLGGK